MEQKKLTVLIVDDQRTVRHMLVTVIEKLGGEVVGEAQDGQEAVDSYLSLRPEMVLMDINMPKMDGIEALKQIMAQDPGALVLMMTSQNTAEAVRECISSGAKNYLLKNNSVNVIGEKIKATWSKHVRESELQDA